MKPERIRTHVVQTAAGHLGFALAYPRRHSEMNVISIKESLSNGSIFRFIIISGNFNHNVKKYARQL